MKDELNSSTTPLGSGATYTGEWVVNNDDHIAFNCLTDQDGFLYLEFSLDGTTDTQVLSKPYELFADEAQFDALVKMPGRYHRVRVVNGATAQTELNLITSTGPNLYPYARSNRDDPKFAVTSATTVTTTSWQIAVDLSDRANFPHHFTGFVDLYGVFFFVSKGANTVGSVRLGVITRVDGTDADVTFVQGVSFNSTSERSFSRDRVFNSPISCAQSGGVLTGITPGSTETAITAINTGTTLTTAYGAATPAVGDIVAKFTHTSGASYDAFASFQYATQSKAS